MASCGKTPDEEQKIDWFLDSVHEHTYAATHAHCTNKLLEGDLTYAMLIKMYTNQCLSKYPHFQLADLNEGKKFSNNANKFRSSFVKGKQGKGKGKDKGMHLIASGEMEKENEETKTIQGTGPTIMGKPIQKIPIKPKEKGMAKDSKGKAKEKESHDTAIGRKTPTTRIIKTMIKSQ